MSKLTLNNVGNLIDATTAATTINTNSAAIVAAMDNTLSRDGTQPNQMQAPLDMNSNQIVNLPAPYTSTSPLRLQDLEDFNEIGEIVTFPPGGTVNQVLTKDSDLDYDVSWQDVDLNISNIQGLGTGVSTFLSTPSSANLRSALTDETGTGSAVFGTSPTLTTPNIVGTTSANNASTGSVGEYLSNVGTVATLTSSTNINGASLTLNPGDWDVTGVFLLSATDATTKYTKATASLSTTSLTLDVNAGRYNQIIWDATNGIVPGNGQGMTVWTGTSRFNISSSTTVYLVCNARFPVGTATGYGLIRARRVR